MKEKELLKELASRVTNTQKPKSRFFILAYKTHIISALNEGYCFKDIYEVFKEKNIYPYSYQQFTKSIKVVLGDYKNICDKKDINQISAETQKIKIKESNKFEFNPKVIDTKNLI
ncbi:Uncharacterised protein [Phocoenobacter uteri]|uniref:Uncharacterized protein n=1 Tax=Phocoenobacter uteri TaxID=146806 RepID=A0A379DGL0_9PAST|nr:TraK family protein [Phocoenobacter uteri]MDG6882832.1 hypothetical protein [Phocoenobacter uteri]SUB76381.1 Uncharacterised protein [Phocoenobacter uteri]SUB76423.1 Uncharacterised protein [Phocoenobacter uteri]